MEWHVQPIDLDLPDKFTSWRPAQTQAMEAMLYGSARFQVLSMPTGSGKTLAVMGGLKLLDSHAAVLTGTKGLQDQYMRDFGPDPKVLRALNVLHVKADIGLTDMRGKGNFSCSEHPGLSCADGPRLQCKCIGTDSCPYSVALKRAQETKTFITNYPCWLNTDTLRQGVDVLVLDEGHLAPEELSKFLGITISEKEILDFAPLVGDQTVQGVMLDMGEDLLEWRTAARQWAKDCQTEIADLLKHLRTAATKTPRHFERLRKLSSLYDKLRKIAVIPPPIPDSPARWVCERFEGHGRRGRYWAFDPVWPGSLAEFHLFRNIPKIIVVSGTIRPKTMHLLGVRPDEYEFHEWKSSFPPNRFPVYSIPSARLRHGMPDSDWRKWLRVIDDIIGSRLDRKGIIHTVSYDRQRYLMENSRHRHLFYANTDDPASPSATQILEDFREAPAPAILVSPSFGTGWDFPYDKCFVPGTRVLTEDLRWKPVESLSVGDRLSGFDEFVTPGRRSRTWKPVTVTSSNIAHKPVYRLTFENGREVTCTADHRWLTCSAGSATWTPTSKLNCGPKQFSSVCEVLPVWDRIDTWEAGYLAGVLDGEGYIHQAFNNWNRSNGEMPVVNVGFAQRDNSVLETACKIMDRYSIGYRVYRHSGSDVCHVSINRRMDMLRLLGMVRPNRLLQQLNLNMVGSLRSSPLRVIDRKLVGTEPVVVMNTDEGTYFAEGIATHNCEFQIISKIPSPPHQSKIMKARIEFDKAYPVYLAVQTMVQQRGRGMRAPDDRCECFIVDDGWVKWFRHASKPFLPADFNVRRMAEIPPPAPKLNRRADI